MEAKNRIKKAKSGIDSFVVSAGDLVDVEARKEMEHWSDVVPGFPSFDCFRGFASLPNAFSQRDVQKA